VTLTFTVWHISILRGTVCVILGWSDGRELDWWDIYMNGADLKCVQNFSKKKKLKGREHSGDIGLGRKIVLK
jgi:hypothetical protein